jgi:MYXO-CTERM domain-containing protein
LSSLVVVPRARAILSFLLALSCLLLAQAAFAAGRVEWKTKELQEREGGSWRLEVAFYMGKAPDVAHVPMKFEFQPTAYFERAMMDGDKLVERTVPLDNRQALIESVDVGFLDSGSGKIESRTRFSFKVTRAHGYEAGEYKVTIRDGRNGQTVGTPVTLVFKGENEIIDRRAMVFSGEKKKKKKDDGENKEGAGNGEEKKDKPASDSAEGDKPAEESAKAKDEAGSGEGSSSSDSSGDEPQTIKEKPGGCGCRLEATSSPSGLGTALSLLLGLGLIARRTRRRAA